MLTRVTSPVSYFEIEIDYQKPDIRLLADRAPLLHGLFEALDRWSPKVDDVEILTAGKMSEQGTMLRLPQQNVAFFVGANLCRFSRHAVKWETAEETILLLDTAVTTLENLTGVKRKEMRTALGMHLQVQEGSFRDVLRPFIGPPFNKLGVEDFTTMASIVRWGSRRVTIDGSGAFANAFFLKMERTFSEETMSLAVAQQLLQDEVEIFQMLGVEASDERAQ